jgi:hypothetical protein
MDTIDSLVERAAAAWLVLLNLAALACLVTL